jgi:hypothetical protein
MTFWLISPSPLYWLIWCGMTDVEEGGGGVKMDADAVGDRRGG